MFLCLQLWKYILHVLTFFFNLKLTVYKVYSEQLINNYIYICINRIFMIKKKVKTKIGIIKTINDNN